MGRGGVKDRPRLTFTLKDAMSDRESPEIPLLNERDRTIWLMPGLKNFTVSVTDPGWISHITGRWW